MGKRLKRRVKRRGLELMRRGTYVCRRCYPVEGKGKYYEPIGEYVTVKTEWGKRRLVDTIFVEKIVVGKTKVIVAWCAGCKRWLAKEVGYYSCLTKMDVGIALSDGEDVGTEMMLEEFVMMTGRDDLRV